MDHGLIPQKGNGANYKMVGIFLGADLFFSGNHGGLNPPSVDR
jgi:hypothetical protein